MAKSSKPTNAFGIDPNSFKAINKPSLDEGSLIESPVQEEKPTVVQQKTPTAVKKDRKTEHIHLLPQKSPTEETDRYAHDPEMRIMGLFIGINVYKHKHVYIN